ncbi:MAG: SDR family oxidoreductase [Bacteroidia bacterium]|nr:SDR family oxidoreductase [Bacteroidia bacterium]
MNVVIVAAASGIGKKIVESFLSANAKLFICDVSEKAIKQFRSEFPKVFVQKTDVANYKEVKSFFGAVKKEVDTLDVLINCAGIAGPTGRLEDLPVEAWERCIQVNVNGMFYCLREGIPMLKRSDSASIINLASSASFFGFPFRSPYASAKWATIGMTKTLAMELGKEGIRVNAICPGSVNGERIDRVIAADAKKQGKSIDEIRELYVKQTSMKTFVEAEDVAQLCLFLASPNGRFISGQAIGLDGHTEGLSTEI